MSNHKLTPLGKVLRKLRIDKGERMIDMSNKLGVSPAFLSAVEVGRKTPPVGLARQIAEIYALGAAECEELSAADAMSRTRFVVEPNSADGRQTVALLARHIDNLSGDELARIREIAQMGRKG